MRVFLGLGDTGGMYSRLEEGLRHLGVECELIDAFPMRDYPRSHRPGWLGRLVESLGRKRWNAPRASAARIMWQGLQGLSLLALLVRSLWKFDVFVFAGGVSFLRGYDLPLFGWFGKRVIVVYHGSDCRPPYINGAYVGADVELDIPGCLRLTRQIYDWVRWVDSHANVVVNHPYATHFNRAPVVSWLSIGNPYKCGPLPPPRARTGACVIVHAPTRPIPKGSVEIEAAINRLRARGHELTFVKIVGRPPAEVLEAIAGCDFVVDELYSDTPVAAFATEAAAMGKATVVGMYDPDTLRSTVSPGAFPPSLVCRPEGLEAAIEKLVVDVTYRDQLGLDAYNYVRTHWDRDVVAGRYLRLAGGEVPEAWTFDPMNVRYVHGWGLHESRLKDVIAAVVSHGGFEALRVSDKPELLREFRELIADQTARRD